MKVSYTWLQGYLTEQLPEPHKLVEVISTRAFEVEGLEQIGSDWMIDIDVLPNRAHDCLSHYGIAKELSVVLDIPFKDFMPKADVTTESTDLKVDIQTDRCNRYVGRIVRNVKVGPSPDWVVDHLKTIGQKSINSVVDATNLIMFDCGQPLHAFDKNKVSGNTIVVKEADVDEVITTLSGDEVKLKDWMLTIRDDVGPLAIAGVKGGNRAEVDENTVDIILESAHFDPVSVRKASRRLAILTDSSKRFENEPTPELAIQAMDRLTQTIIEIASTPETVFEDIVDVYPNKPQKHSVSFVLQDVTDVLGIVISENEVENILKRFEFEYALEGGLFTVQIPDERLDLRMKEDIIEELGRVYGYNKIEAVVPEVSEKPAVNKEFYYITKIKQFFVERGFSEVYTYSFDKIGDVKVKNPIASDKGRLRNSLVPGLKNALDLNMKNAPLLGDEVKLFEIGTVFAKDMSEETVVGFTGADCFAELTEYLGQMLEASVVGGITEFSLTELLDKLPEPTDDLRLKLIKDAVVYEPFSLYPFNMRDISVWMPEEGDKQELVNIIRQHGGELVASEPRLVDEFAKDGRVSYSYRIAFQSKEKTLTDAEVNQIMGRVYAEAGERDGWEVR